MLQLSLARHYEALLQFVLALGRQVKVVVLLRLLSQPLKATRLLLFEVRLAKAIPVILV